MFAAFIDGWRRVIRAHVLSVAVVLAVLLLAVPLHVPYDDPATPQLGNRLEAEAALALAHGELVSGLNDHDALATAVHGAAGAYLLFWMFLSGGILDRVARNRPVGTAQFFASCGVYFVRFLRLALVIGLTYGALFHWLRPYLRSDVAFLAILAFVSLVSDFAKVRAVVEDRRSMLGALAAALRFMRRRPVQTAALYVLNVLAAVVIMFMWLHADRAADASAWAVVVLWQLYLVLRILARLAFMASEVAYFQSQLAHAEYTAAPELVWPDSPAVEAIQNLHTWARKPSR